MFAAEILLVFGVGAYALHRQWIGAPLGYLFLSLAALIFALFYGIKGALASLLAMATGVYLIEAENFPYFLSRHYLPASFLTGALIIAGMVRSAMEARMVGAELNAEVLDQRLDRLTVELSEKDYALQEAFREVLTDTESPVILYQALRRIERLRDPETLFEEVLQLLYRHCHVEKSCIYEVRTGRRFRRVAVFGPSQLPERLSWDSLDMPQILRVARQQQEVIVPVQLSHHLTMAVPLVGRNDRLRYVLLVEEIRFINFNETVIHLLKLAAFWLKYIIEAHLSMAALRPYSRFETVIVYRPEVARRLLGRSMTSHHKYRLPYALLLVAGGTDEAEAQWISGRLRIYDELFLLDDRRLVILLSMIRPHYVDLVRRRLTQRLGEERVRPLGRRIDADEH